MKQKLFMVIIGCTPEGRLTEQHDAFFGIANSLKDLVPEMIAFWPEAKGIIHIDSWREVTNVDGYSIEVIQKQVTATAEKLFFLNLGGYKPGELEEFHYKLLTVSETLSGATKRSKETAFYKHYGFKGATSHVDEKYGIDIDDAHKVEDILPKNTKDQFQLKITKQEILTEDELHIGYLKISKLLKL